MGKEKPALKPDIIVKNYWRNKEQFADFFNAVLFDGKQVIKPKELEDLDTEEPPFWSIKNMRKASERREIRSKFEKSLPYMAWNLLYWEWKDRSIFIMRCPCG